MPRDVFWLDPDGNVVMQGYMSFTGLTWPDGSVRDEATLTREELDVRMTWAEVEEFRGAAHRHQQQFQAERLEPAEPAGPAPVLPVLPALSSERERLAAGWLLGLWAGMYALFAATMLVLGAALVLHLLT